MPIYGADSVCNVPLFPRWSWRGSVGEAGAARWPWMTSPWGKAPAQRSTIWGDSNWQSRRKERQKENKREKSSQRENWLCYDTPSLCLSSCWILSQPRPSHLLPTPSCERYSQNCASAEQLVSLSLSCPGMKGLNQISWISSSTLLSSQPPSHSITLLLWNLHVPTYHGNVLHPTQPWQPSMHTSASFLPGERIIPSFRSRLFPCFDL